ncbi:class I adenylate-forming enzyme family protein [Sphingopyxis sp. KK2]|uniref:class I adenylate-forming enzyme family protein n=1 Tax=Sphingopyxis sp. KK2 TaxID=1855727 RepID=UPI00097E5765|nr:AMP-binding protein [Sphingopyxis sp. KK2]
MLVDSTHPTSAELLLASLKRNGPRPAVTADDSTLTYAELDALSDRLAMFLGERGVERDVAVALYLRNSAEYVVAEFAILKLGAVRVPLNELMGGPELAYCLDHSGAKVLIADADLARAAPDDEHRIDILVGETAALSSLAVGWAEAVAGEGLFATRAAAADDTAIIAYTGGTTGRPKGVRHSYGRMAWNLFSHINCLDIRTEEVMLLTTPLPHSSGYHMVAGLLQGAHVIIERRFDPDRFFALCREDGVTWTMMVPTMLYRLLDHPAAGGGDHSRLNTIVYGAAPISRPRLEEGLRKFGKVFLQIYGQTECPNLITTLGKDDHERPELLASCGRAVPLVALRLQPEGADAGEVEVSSPYLLTEYYRDEGATRQAVDEGWLKTGDLGRIEDGYLFLVDRAKDMIISGGMNVYSTEVEAVLREHGSVREAAVVGLPHADWGEAVTAIVVADEGVAAEDIRLFAKARLSAYKVPKTVQIVERLPLTQYGKIDKKRIRELLIASAGAAS